MGEPATGQLIRLIRKSELARDIQGFIIDRQARGLSPRTIEFYADELRHWQHCLNSKASNRFKKSGPATCGTIWWLFVSGAILAASTLHIGPCAPS